MSGINHAVGGTVFTALFSSFWNINIFSKIEYLFVCVFFSLLPDIDFPQSPIGRVCYPLSRYLERNFGHRTLTHSVTVFIPLVVGSLLIERHCSEDTVYSVIIGFSYLSHLTFDMMTKEGVPLFYPFDKTFCVMPSNADFRLETGNAKTEWLVLCSFILIGITCNPLFKEGFLSALNKRLGNIKNLYYEFISYPNELIEVSYHFRHVGESYQGKGYLIYSIPHKAILFNKGFIEINQECQIKQLVPVKTKLPYHTKQLYFDDISLDSLLSIIEDKPLLSLQLSCNEPIRYISDQGSMISNQLSLSYVYNPLIDIKSNQYQERCYQIQLLIHQLEGLLEEKRILKLERRNLQACLGSIEHELVNANAYKREKLTRRLKEVRKELARMNNLKKERDYARRISHLSMQLSYIKNIPKPVFKGYIKYVQFDHSG